MKMYLIIFSGVRTFCLFVGSWFNTVHVAWKACNEHVTELEIYVHVVLLFMLHVEESAELINLFSLCLLWRINFLILHTCISMMCRELSLIFKYSLKSCTLVLITDPMFFCFCFLTETTLSTKKTLKPSTGG